MIDKKIIGTVAELAAKQVVSALKREGLLKCNRHSSFKKTETLLYNYNNFKNVVNDKLEQIKIIREEGVQNKSSSITLFSSVSTYELKSDAEKIEEKIKEIEKTIKITMDFIKIIDSAISTVEDDPYFDIIRMKYFENRTREEIAEYFEVDASTISRNKNRLINVLQIRLFSDEVICQIFA